MKDVPEGGARGFSLPRGERPPLAVVVVRRSPAVHVYVNRCPHRGTPLDWRPDDFFDASGEHLVCATHGAVFRVEDGLCLAGPCAGDALAPLSVELRDGHVVALDVPD